jgi:hypothetical protein
MIRLAAAPFALILFAAPLAVLPAPALAGAGVIALLLAAAGLAGGWRAPVTAAACVFLVEYTVAVWARGGPLRPAGAVVVGLALLGLIQAADLVILARRATVEAAVIRAQLGRWLAVGAGALAAVALGMAAATALASAISSAMAPLLAAAAALGVVATAARLLARSGPRAREPGR